MSSAWAKYLAFGADPAEVESYKYPKKYLIGARPPYTLLD